jgi:multidrug efflux system outer membrane protein
MHTHFRQSSLFVLAGSSLLVITACSVGPEYRRPEIAMPVAWQAEQGSSSAVWPATDWWQGFGSQQLNSLIAAAQQANDDLAAATARVREADAQARIAGAALLPSLTLSGDGARQRQQLPGTSSGLSDSTQYNLQLSASYELDFWGKNRAAREAAVATAFANRYDQGTVALTVVSSVANGYFQAVEYQERFAIAQKNLGNAQTVLKSLQHEQEVGIASALDVAQQATTVANLNATIPPLQLQLRQAINALAILTGSAPEDLKIALEKFDEISAPEVQAGLPSELLARRPDVAMAEAQLISANADIKTARAAFFPSISLTAAGGYTSSAVSSLISPASRVFSVGGSLTQSIFKGGSLKGQYDYSKARYDELLANYHKAVISAFSDVENALMAVQRTSDQLQREQEAVNQAQRAYDYAQSQFRGGIINIITLLNTQTSLFSAEDTLMQVKFSHLQALVSLFNALGGGWQQPNVNVG